jgi:ribosome-associated protein
MFNHNAYMIPYILLNESECKFTFIRAPGPGGQNVNKVASAVQLRVNIRHSPSLPEDVRARLVRLLSKRLTTQGDLLIRASRYRTQERNKQDALERLRALVRRAAVIPKKRTKTKPSYGSKLNRLAEKKLHAKTKALRSKRVRDE